MTTTDNPIPRLEALGSMTQETEAANPDPAAAQAEQAAQAKASEADAAAKQWGMLMFMVGGMCQMIAPELKTLYTEERCTAWGHQANAVAEKYGWNGPSALPELALIASTAVFVVPSVLQVRARIKAAQANNPAGLAAKFGMWWRARKATAKAKAGPTVTDVEDKHGGK